MYRLLTKPILIDNQDETYLSGNYGNLTCLYEELQ